jgi:hypothetical protein
MIRLSVVIVVGATASTVVAQPAPRACYSAAATPAGMVIWGGARACGVDVLSDSSVWRWNGTRWQSFAGPPIVPREDALLIPGPDSTLTLIGGRRAGVVYSDVWRFDGRRWLHSTPAGGPGELQHGSAAYDPVRKRIVVFGGAVGRTPNGRTWEFDGAAWHAFDVPGPAPRVAHGMTWSADDGGASCCTVGSVSRSTATSGNGTACSGSGSRPTGPPSRKVRSPWRIAACS